MQYLNLGQPNTTASVATGINNAGQIVGYLTSEVNSQPNWQGFLYQNGTTSLLPFQIPTAINNSGEIAGYSGSNAFLQTHGFTLAIPSPMGYQTLPTGLDSSGRVIGVLHNFDFSASSVFIYSGGFLNVIPTDPPYLVNPTGGGSNDCGEFVGYYDDESGGDSGVQHRYLYANGFFNDLEDLFAAAGAPYDSFAPYGINNRGDIFGLVQTNNGTLSTMIMVRTAPESCGTDATIVNTPSSSTVGPEGEVTYTIEVKNLKAPTTQFTVSNALGREARLLSCAVDGSIGTCSTAPDERSVSVSLPDLAKGTTAAITITVRIVGTSGDDQAVIDTATLSSSATADYLSTAYTKTRLTADLSVSASLVSNYEGLLYYPAIVTDPGPNNSHAALLLDPLPANTSYVSASTNYGTCSFHPTLGPNGSIRCPLGNLAHSVSAEVDVVLQVSPAACPSVTNTFALTGQSMTRTIATIRALW